MEMTREKASPPSATFSAQSRWGARASLLVGLFLSVYILFVANGIIFRHPVRFDLTEEKLLSLSKDSLERLKLIKEPIEVVIPTLLLKENPDHLAQHEVLARARLLLNEYLAAQPLLTIAAEVDVLARPDRWERIRADYKLESSQVNRFIFVAGSAKERRQTVTPGDLAFFAPARDPAVDVPQVKAFRGERAITDALSRIMTQDRRAVYFTQDKGEAQFRPKNERAIGVGGIRALLSELDSQGLEGRPLAISGLREIPADCSALVIAGANQPFAPDELRVLDGYLQGGGKLLVALGVRRTGLEGLLEDWSVKVPDGQVQSYIDTQLSKTSHAIVAARQFSRSHPATSIFVNVPRFEVQLELPRPLTASGKGKGLEAEPILGAASQRGLEYYLVGLPDSKGLPKPDDFDLVLAVSQHVPERPPPGFQRLETRIIAAGSSTFLSDQYFLRSSNRDFLMNSLGWLLGDEVRSTSGSAEWANRTLHMDAAIEKYLFWVPIFLLPGVFLTAGALVYFARRT